MFHNRKFGESAYRKLSSSHIGLHLLVGLIVKGSIHRPDSDSCSDTILKSAEIQLGKRGSRDKQRRQSK